MTVAGVQMITIPVTEYADLLECRRRLAEMGVRKTRFVKASKSPIERDPELATFIAERLGRMVVKDVQSACEDRFGPTRTPSRSAIHRYWERLREAEQ